MKSKQHDRKNHVARTGKLAIAKTTLRDLDVHAQAGSVRGGTDLVTLTDPITVVKATAKNCYIRS